MCMSFCSAATRVFLAVGVQHADDMTVVDTSSTDNNERSDVRAGRTATVAASIHVRRELTLTLSQPVYSEFAIQLTASSLSAR